MDVLDRVYISPDVAKMVASGEVVWMQIEEALNYEVSTNGDIRLIGSSTNRVQAVSVREYKQLNLNCNGKTRTVKTHRLVAKAFLANPHNHPAINHIDGNKINNKIENLEWCSNRHNAEHLVQILGKRIGEKSASAKLTNQEATEIRQATGSYSDLAEKYGVSVTVVSGIRRHEGWKYLEAETTGIHIVGKVSPEMALAIQSDPGKQKDIASQFGVSPSTVSRIKRGILPNFSG